MEPTICRKFVVLFVFFKSLFQGRQNFLNEVFMGQFDPLDISVFFNIYIYNPGFEVKYELNWVTLHQSLSFSQPLEGSNGK